MGEGRVPRISKPLSRQNAEIFFTHSSCFSLSLTIPPLPTNFFPTSNWGLMRAIKMPPSPCPSPLKGEGTSIFPPPSRGGGWGEGEGSRNISTIFGIIFVNEIKETSTVTTSTGSDKSFRSKFLKLVRSITTTRGSFLKLQSS